MNIHVSTKCLSRLELLPAEATSVRSWRPWEAIHIVLICIAVRVAAALPQLFSHLVLLVVAVGNMGEVFCWVLVGTTVSVVFHQSVPLHWPSYSYLPFMIPQPDCNAVCLKRKLNCPTQIISTNLKKTDLKGSKGLCVYVSQKLCCELVENDEDEGWEEGI